MRTEWLVSLALFALTTSITPGPNNLMLTASGANFGILRSVPHMLGILIGFPLMLVIMGLGSDVILHDSTLLHRVLKIVGVLYFSWMAYKIATSSKPEINKAQQKRPFSLFQAAIFQWINGKAWIMALGAITTYTTVGGDITKEVIVLVIIFALFGFASNLIWATFGVVIGRLLKTPRTLRAFNLSMAALLVASFIPFVVS